MSEHDDAILAEWLKHPGAKIAYQRIHAERERRAAALWTLILDTNLPIDMQKVDKERGFRDGAEWFLREAKKGKRAFERNQGGETV